MSDTPIPNSPSALALHTTSPQLGLAVREKTGTIRSQTWDLGRDLSTHLHVLLAEFLDPQTWKDLDWIAVAKGPGGFTGTRIGVVTARMVAQQLQIPVFSISSLAALVVHTQLPQQTVAVEMEARRQQRFVGIYQRHCQGTIAPLLEDTTMSQEQWQQTLNDLKVPYSHLRVPDHLGMSAPSLLELATHAWQQGVRPTWAQAVPFYGQHPVP